MLRSLGLSLTVLASLALIALIAVAGPRCADESHFQYDAAAADSKVWQYDGLSQGDIYVNPCSPKPAPAVTGKVYAPNGVDPVAGASVHVALGLLPLPKEVQCESCSVKGKFSAHTYTKADGSFELKGVPDGKPFWLGIQKGYFRRYLNLTVPQCSTVALTKDQTKLPGKNKQFGQYDSIPRIAVVSGAWDKMEKVLDKLGVPPGEITIYNGRDYGTGPLSMQALLQNAGLMKSFHIILINCGTKFEALVTSTDPIARNAIREYVRAGGRLFVTDFSYDYVEQVFPEFIDFEASDGVPPEQPETHNAAEVGTQDLKFDAQITDPDLKAWLALPEIKALKSNGKVPVEGFMTGWAVQKTANQAAGAKVWVEGPVKWIGGAGTRPLTTSFDFLDSDNKGCGRVIFSSYHTWGDATELLPQERILEYLILEIGTCINIK
jgi:hypothetical protein